MCDVELLQETELTTGQSAPLLRDVARCNASGQTKLSSDKAVPFCSDSVRCTLPVARMKNTRLLQKSCVCRDGTRCVLPGRKAKFEVEVATHPNVFQSVLFVCILAWPVSYHDGKLPFIIDAWLLLYAIRRKRFAS